MERQDPSTIALVAFLLSPYRVLVGDDGMVAWPGGRTRSIFAYLIAHRQRPVARDVLMATFWPEHEPQAARNNLNVSLCLLRKAIAAAGIDRPAVVHQDGCYALDPGIALWVDAEAFRALADRGMRLARDGDLCGAMNVLESAAALYEGDYLADFRYEDWVRPLRDTFRRAFLDMSHWMGREAERAGNYAGAVSITLRALAVDNCDEELHCRLMRCYRLLGQHHLALRQFHACKEALARELGTTPGLAIVRLHDAIRHRRLDGPASAS
jgi:DNA-binding SARP family transcriptional activator